MWPLKEASDKAKSGKPEGSAKDATSCVPINNYIYYLFPPLAFKSCGILLPCDAK